MTLFTIGHSNQPIEPFLSALAAHRIALVIDVRRFPSSRRHPQFGQSRLAASLRDRGIDYMHVPELGGHRQPRADSQNTVWRNEAFRGYADHMETPEFRAAVERVLDEAARRPAAVMCAELLWSHCHRGLIADYVKAAGHDVIHVVSAERSEGHPFTHAARVVDGRLSYQGLL